MELKMLFMLYLYNIKVLLRDEVGTWISILGNHNEVIFLQNISKQPIKFLIFKRWTKLELVFNFIIKCPIFSVQIYMRK